MTPMRCDVIQSLSASPHPELIRSFIRHGGIRKEKKRNQDTVLCCASALHIIKEKKVSKQSLEASKRLPKGGGKKKLTGQEAQDAFFLPQSLPPFE